MKDYEFINEQNKRLQEDFLKARKHQKKLDRIKAVFYTFAFIIAVIISFMIVRNDYKKAVQHCVKQGNTYEYCVTDSAK